jgi:glycosyltransferase involved in cell wall biosynthesis
MADFPVCVSEDDRAVFASQGVDAQVIPNSVAVPELIGLTAEEARRTVSEAGATLPERYVLFIGSAHGPNNDAANFLRELAESFALSGGEVSIVVAGTCHAPLQEPTFRALGRVSDAVKDALYVLGAAVVAPLVSGTGTSLKTIEAMAMGKTVIGTSMAFRGLGVTHGKNAIVEDDLQSYEWLLPDLLEDADRLTDIGREARRLAEQFDYRRTYRPYMEYLDSLDIVRPLTGN